MIALAQARSGVCFQAAAPPAARRTARTVLGISGVTPLQQRDRMASSSVTRRASAASRQPVVAQASAAAGDVQGDMLDKASPANVGIVRLAAVLLTIAAVSRSTEYLPAAGAAFVHLLAYGVQLGAIVWTTFIAGIVMFKNLPRQTFGRLQSKLFPIYFGLSTGCSAIQLGVLLFAAAAAPQKQLVLVGLSLAFSALSWLAVEPFTTKIMFQRYDLENAPTRDEAAIKALSKQFGKWHGISSLINLGALITVIGHGWWLASKLVGILA